MHVIVLVVYNSQITYLFNALHNTFRYKSSMCYICNSLPKLATGDVTEVTAGVVIVMALESVAVCVATYVDIIIIIYKLTCYR